MASRGYSDEPAPPSLTPIQPPAPDAASYGFFSRQPAEAPYQPYPPADQAGPRGSWRGQWLHPATLVRIGIALIVLAGSSLALWWTYSNGHQAAYGGEVPLIKADTAAMKVKPANPGGMANELDDAIAYQPNNAGNGQVENLLAPPEEPLPKPAPAPDAIEAPKPPPPPAAADVAPVPPPVAPPPVVAAPVAPAPAKPVASAPKLVAPAAAPKPAPERQSLDQTVAKLAAEPAPVAAGGGYHVQLGSTRDAATARSEWTRIQKAHGDLLGSLSANFAKADLGDRGIYYRIQAGPLDKAAAQKLCGQLHAAQIGCLVVK